MYHSFSISLRMKNITFHFTLSEDAGLRSTGLPDWIAFGYVCFVSTILFTCVLLMITRRKYAPLRAKDLSKLIAMTIFGTIHIWGAFVTNDHFEYLRNIQRPECSLFSFWIQYFLGLNLWLIVLILRLKTYMWVFYDTDNHSNPVHFICWQVITTAVLALPILLICLVTTLQNGVTWEPIHGHCVTHLPYKILLLAWIAFGLITMIYFHVRIRRKLTTDYYREYEPLGNIVQAGIVVVVFNGLIIFFGGLTFPIGRTIATCLVASLHLFALFRFAGYEMFKAAICDNAYESKFMHNQRILITKGVTIKDLMGDEQIIEDFLCYCSSKPPMLFKIGETDKELIAIYPNLLVDCRKAILIWVLKYPSVNDQGNTLDYERVIDEYFSTDSKRYTSIDKNVIERAKAYEGEVVPQNVFNEMIDYIPAFLSRFWGEDYLKDIPKRSIYAKLIVNRLGIGRGFGVISRLGELKLLDTFGLQAYIFEEEEDDMLELNLLSTDE